MSIIISNITKIKKEKQTEQEEEYYEKIKKWNLHFLFL